MNSSNTPQITKIYRVTHQTWIYDKMGNHSYQTHFEGSYINKEYAERVLKDQDDKIRGYQQRMFGEVSLKEIDVIFNSNGSYQEITISKEKKFLDKVYFV